MQIKRSKIRKLLKIATVFIAITCVMIGIVGIYRQYIATHKPNIKVDTKVVTKSTNQPEETPPKECPKVASKLPRDIEMPSINAKGCVQVVGVDQKRAIAVPNNVHVAGWYVGSSVPGEAGVSIVDGHVSGVYSDGIFKDINKLSPGDNITVHFGDDSKRIFVVKTINSYSPKETSKQQYKKILGVDKQLTLVTCGGQFDSNKQQFDQRVVVRAELSQ